MALTSALDAILNRPAATVILEQMRKLYMRLYPYMTADFAHSEDVRVALKEIDAKLEALTSLVTSHVHPVVPNAPATSIPAISAPAMPPTVLTNSIALSLILPTGYPQPTGEAIPAVLPSRVGAPNEVVAQPPLNPADITGAGII